MKLLVASLLSGALIASAAMPAQAQSLLGVIGSPDSGSLVTIGSGDAGSSGLVNVGVGGDNQVLDANIGNGSIGSANVGSGRGSALDANVNLLNGGANVGAKVGGPRVLDVNVGVGGNRGNTVNPNGPGNAGNLNSRTASGGGQSGAGVITCSGVSSQQLEQLLRSTRIDNSWRRASNVSIQRVPVCAEMRSWLAATLSQTGLGPNLHQAVVSDPLLSASLSRTSYSPDRVFAVQKSGNDLKVFVY